MTELHERKRRAHQKSRKGCNTCKKRKVKCSEEQPHCSQCLKLGLECTYLQRARQSLPLPTIELGLLWHWTVYTSRDLLPSLEHTWSTELPKLALSHPFLMRLIFAISAMHQGDDGREYRNSGFIEFRQLLDDGIDAENAEAMMGSAILLAIHAFSEDGVMRMFNGIRFVAEELWKVLPDSLFSSIISPTLDIPPCPESFILFGLSQNGLENAVGQLAFLYSLDAGSITQELMFTWPILLPPDMEQGDPQYQVLVFWYFAKCIGCDHIWWIKESATRECAAIDVSLPAEYRHLLPNSTNSTIQY